MGFSLKDTLKKWVNPIEAIKDTYDEASKLPGTWESISKNVVDMSRGDVSANPFDKDEASGWDKAAGGQWLSQYPEARTVGRMIGSYFAGGAGGLAGKGAVAGAGALGNAYDAKQAAEQAQQLVSGLRGVGGGVGGATGGGGPPLPPQQVSAALRQEPLPKLFDPNYKPKPKATTTVDLASGSEEEEY